jgi:NAD(P)-dependent dehydrogenase (short-subunit alcohol dehydrogenase family)
MITGANSGIGKEVALGLAQFGATTLLVCREQTKGEAARSEIIGKSGNKSVELMLADLSSLASVRKLADDFKKTHDRLNVLVNNAGLIMGKRVMTVDNLETTFEVNYLSHFLLTMLLLDTLKASSPSRVVNVTSSASLSGHIEFDDLQEMKGYSAMKSYSQSKLAQVLFTYELARRLAGTGVTVNAVHPGVVRTSWGDEGGALGIGIRLGRPFMISPKSGAETPIYLSSSAEVEGVTGKYFYKKRENQSSKESYDEDEAKRLWDVSLKLTGLA